MNNIEILEEFVNQYNIDEDLFCFINYSTIQAIENIMQENKELRIQISARETVVDELNKENKKLKEDISNMYDEKVVRNILENECGLSKCEIEEILN